MVFMPVCTGCNSVSRKLPEWCATIPVVSMKSLDQYWYGRNIVSSLLLPLSWLFMMIAAVRRSAYRKGLLAQTRLPVPVIIVGNITVGGTGKTPLTAWLVESLKRHGLRPGIISRGYKGKASDWPQQVRSDSSPELVGDEAVLLAQQCHCPVVVDPQRIRAGRALLAQTPCDIIIADDGLQHYRLARDIEIVVVDGVRRFGNGRYLPAGPLREPMSRLDEVDYIVVNDGATQAGEFGMNVQAGQLRRVNNPSVAIDAATMAALGPAHGVAGIGNPQRFFALLSAMGFDTIDHQFPDHFAYRESDIRFADSKPVIMTEKDAVKCHHFADDNCWFVPITAVIDPQLEIALLAQVDRLFEQR